MNRPGRVAAAALFVAGLVGPTAVRAEASLSVTVIGDPRDPRAAAVEEAVEFWNGELGRIGAGVRLGPVHFVDDESAARVLESLENGELRVGDTSALRRLLPPIPGEVVVALSRSDRMSFGTARTARTKGFVSLRRGDVEPLSLPNVARNAAAHELGHTLGLDHNDDPATLMCGRPAPCRPAMFESTTARFFPLTPDEERRLRELWPR